MPDRISCLFFGAMGMLLLLLVLAKTIKLDNPDFCEKPIPELNVKQLKICEEKIKKEGV